MILLIIAKYTLQEVGWLSSQHSVGETAEMRAPKCRQCHKEENLSHKDS